MSRDRKTKSKPPTLIPRKLLFGNPERAAVTVSPDGSKLAFLAPVEGVLNVWVAPISSGRALVGWSAAPRSTGYNIYHSINGGPMQLAGTVDSSTTRFDDTSLPAGSTVSVSVTATNASGSSGQAAAPAPVTTDAAGTGGAFPSSPRVASVTLARTAPGHLAAPDQAATTGTVESRSLASYRNDGNAVDVDASMTQLAETQLKYGATSRLLSGQLGMLRDVITSQGGR